MIGRSSRLAGEPGLQLEVLDRGADRHHRGGIALGGSRLLQNRDRLALQVLDLLQDGARADHLLGLLQPLHGAGEAAVLVPVHGGIAHVELFRYVAQRHAPGECILNGAALLVFLRVKTVTAMKRPINLR